MELKKIETKKAPGAIGPYSQGIAANGFLFISGQTPTNAETGEMCTGSMAEQTRGSLNNLMAIAKEAGTDLSKTVKTTVFLTDMNDFAEVNEEYKKFFPNLAPARSCFAVAALPKNARVEIEAIIALR